MFAALRRIAGTAAVVLVASGCTAGAPPTPQPSSSQSAPAASSSPTAVGTTSADWDTFGVDGQVIDEVAQLCAPGPGKTVEELPDEEIAAESWEGVDVAEQRAGDVVVPALEVKPVEIPATRTEAGCIVTYDAAAGCLPRVTISPAWIPGVRVEGYSFQQPDGSTVTVDGVAIEATVTEAVTVEGVCQIEQKDAVPSVYRPAAYRKAVYRRAGYRGAGYRAAAYERGDSVPSERVPSRSIASVSLGSTQVPSEYLPYRWLTDGVDAAGDEQQATYQASESVLFAYNRSELLPTASAALDAILADAAGKVFEGRVLVEGHTDDTGEDAGNQRLSQDRAQAVAGYLAAHGIDASRIEATGRGESSPAFPNDSDANRAKNRRVVLEFREG